MTFAHKQSIVHPEYATAADFEKMFTEEMDRLYQLAFVVTADPKKAEQVFSGALDSCLKATHVFQPWVRSWAKRSVVLSAIAMISPRPESSSWLQAPIPANIAGAGSELESVLGLPDFERAVFVMTVLEPFSERECALLLGTTLRTVRDARERALRATAWAGPMAAIAPLQGELAARNAA